MVDRLKFEPGAIWIQAGVLTITLNDSIYQGTGSLVYWCQESQYVIKKDTPERKQATEILLIHIECSVMCDMWGKNGSITAIQSVTLFCLPVRQMCVSVELVYQSKLPDVMASSEHCNIVCRCIIFLQIK
jgi:hypothetical protein